MFPVPVIKFCLSALSFPLYKLPCGAGAETLETNISVLADIPLDSAHKDTGE